MFKTGLIIGKFDPLHLGHQYLIETAQAEAESVTVLVCSSRIDRFPIEVRLDWLRQRYPTIYVEVLYPDQFDRNDATAWITATRQVISFTPDCIFSSEDYGILYAKMMGCQHQMVDRDRLKFPCSSTQIQQNHDQFRQFLEPHVAAYLV